MWVPKIELLYFADCPHYLQALAMVHDVLAAAGSSALMYLVAVETPAEVERQHLYGSPTVRVDGVDIVPPDSSARPALACRVYRTAQGALTPIPPAEVLAATIQHR